MHDLRRPDAMEDAPWRRRLPQLMQENIIEIPLYHAMDSGGLSFIRLQHTASQKAMPCAAQFLQNQPRARPRMALHTEYPMLDGKPLIFRILCHLNPKQQQDFPYKLDDDFLPAVQIKFPNLQDVPCTPCNTRRTSPHG